MEPKFSPPSKGAILGLKVIFFFPLLPLGAIVSAVVDFFLCKRGGEAGKEGFSANEKKAWRKIWCGFFFQCGCNGQGAPPPQVVCIEVSTQDRPFREGVVFKNPFNSVWQCAIMWG